MERSSGARSLTTVENGHDWLLLSSLFEVQQNGSEGSIMICNRRVLVALVTESIEISNGEDFIQLDR
jgi:hypothetical protein